MGSIKEINMKNCTYYFIDDMIKIEGFSLDLLKTDKNLYKDVNIY